MRMTTWNPFREMDELMSHYQRVGMMPGLGKGDMDWSPAVDIKENKQEYLIEADLPGVSKDDIKVSIHNGVLTLEGERKVEKEDKDEKHHRVERFYGHFTRSFSLPEDVEADKINADSKDGIIKVHLPKAKKAKPKSIEVKVS